MVMNTKEDKLLLGLINKITVCKMIFISLLAFSTNECYSKLVQINGLVNKADSLPTKYESKQGKGNANKMLTLTM